MENEKDTEKVDQRYKDGFEMAYWLQRGENSILERVMDVSENDRVYHQGLQAGQKEALRYMVKDRFEKYKSKTNSQDKSIDMD